MLICICSIYVSHMYLYFLLLEIVSLDNLKTYLEVGKLNAQKINIKILMKLATANGRRIAQKVR